MPQTTTAAILKTRITRTERHRDTSLILLDGLPFELRPFSRFCFPHHFCIIIIITETARQSLMSARRCFHDFILDRLATPEPGTPGAHGRACKRKTMRPRTLHCRHIVGNTGGLFITNLATKLPFPGHICREMMSDLLREI